MNKSKQKICPVAWTAAIISSSWTPLILRDLLLNDSRRFQDFQKSLSGIPPTTLSERLKKLEEYGIVERRFYQQHPPRAEYLLTTKGKQLGSVVRAMRNWGKQFME